MSEYNHNEYPSYISDDRYDELIGYYMADGMSYLEAKNKINEDIDKKIELDDRAWNPEFYNDDYLPFWEDVESDWEWDEPLREE